MYIYGQGYALTFQNRQSWPLICASGNNTYIIFGEGECSRSSFDHHDVSQQQSATPWTLAPIQAQPTYQYIKGVVHSPHPINQALFVLWTLQRTTRRYSPSHSSTRLSISQRTLNQSIVTKEVGYSLACHLQLIVRRACWHLFSITGSFYILIFKLAPVVRFKEENRTPATRKLNPTDGRQAKRQFLWSSFRVEYNGMHIK